MGCRNKCDVDFIIPVRSRFNRWYIMICAHNEMENTPNVLFRTHNIMKYAHNEMENSHNILISTHNIMK